MRFRFLIPLFLLACRAQATEIFYPGTFDPFHNTHYQEVLMEMRKTPGAKVMILPIEDAFYNRQFGLPRPQLFPYSEKLDILREAFRGQPNVTVSESLQVIDKNALKTILETVSRSNDPDKRILIGTDVLDLWKDLPGFAKLKAQVTLVVDEDVKDTALSTALAKKFAGDPHISFVRNDGNGIRSSVVTKQLINGEADKAFGAMPPAFREHYKDPKKLAALIDDFKVRQTAWEQRLLEKETIPILKNAGVDATLLNELKTNDVLQNAFLALDPKDEVAVKRFVAQANALLDDNLSEGKVARQLTKALGSKEYQGSAGSQHFGYVRYLFGDYHPAEEPLASSVKPPPFLYHWTNQEKLEAMDAYNLDKTKLPLRFLKPRHYVVTEHPELAGHEGVYSWSNPVTGMAADKSEVYARLNGGNPPRLLVMKPRADAKVIEITTHTGSLTPVATPNLDKYDLVLNKAYDANGKLQYSEWIVLKPEAIESFSADPHAAEAVMRAELAKLEQPGFMYSEDELFYQEFKDKDYWIKRTKDFLKRNSARDIPPSLRRKMDEKEPSCPREFARIGK